MADIFQKCFDFTRADDVKKSGLYPYFRPIEENEGPVVQIEGKKMIMAGSNNYLGLTAHPRVKEAAIKAIEKYGTGCSGSRYLTGTLDLHIELEKRMAKFFGTEAVLLFSTGYQTAQGIIPTIVQKGEYIVSDKDNHACIVAADLMAKGAFAEFKRYKHNDMADLEEKLKATMNKRHRMIVTDGVFSMDGTIAQLDKICDLADRYQALIMIDECHASGFMGKTGRGTHEHHGVMGRIDIITGTLGKALGGAMGGFTSGRKEIIEMLRQRSRPYLFSNSLAPSIVGASIAVLDMLSQTTTLRDKLWDNTQYFRKQISEAGFDIKPGQHPIVPIMLYEAQLAQQFAAMLLDEGIYVTGFFYPVVAKGNARIRVQLSAGHERHHIDKALNAFIKVGKKLGVIK